MDSPSQWERIHIDHIVSLWIQVGLRASVFLNYSMSNSQFQIPRRVLGLVICQHLQLIFNNLV